tara:strand:+ start:73 stop:624 length:552 start_codon:yes stop_codon:yes gene_type:complete
LEENLLTLIHPSEYDIEIEMLYAKSDNFTGRVIYTDSRCFLHPTAAHSLKKAINLASEQGLKLLVYDAYRPTEAQWELWHHNPDPMFLTDPNKGSPHSRGVAIDVTLIDSTKGKLLDMGGEVDDLTPNAFHGCNTISTKAQKNRMLLLGLMATAGFDHYLNEWWHYQLYNARNYPLISSSAIG